MEPITRTSRRALLQHGSMALGLAVLPWCPGAGRAAGAAHCMVRPQQTEGPYFLDAERERSDLRLEPGSSTPLPGVPLSLAFLLSQSDAQGGCAPLADAVVDVWHCDAQGAYSGFGETVGRHFLRGHQRSDAGGRVRFTTLYPGWYPGRPTHIHFKVRTEPDGDRGREFTSQLYFDDALSDTVYRLPAYAGRDPSRRQRNADDGIFERRGGAQLLLPLTPRDEGYAGVFAVALAPD